MLVLDLDGTLFDTIDRWHECEKLANGNKRMFWECFQSSRFMNLVKRASVQFSETEESKIVSHASQFL
jgi:phosphoglycolate phosphatase-like HAD superfamily hydrolase